LASVGGVSGCKARCLATADCEAVCVTLITVAWEDPVKMCGLRRDVWSEKCVGDTHHDTYVIETPSPPPPPPRIPIPRMNPAERAATLNARFRDAQASSNLARAGVVIHHFDGLETKGEPWRSCNFHCDNEISGSSLTGRLSTSIIYGPLQNRADRVSVPLVSNDGGVIARPSDGLQISCAFGIDGATKNLGDGPNGVGCPSTWCDPSGQLEANGYCGFWGAPPQAAWRAENLDKLLELHKQHGVQWRPPGYHSGYNEAVVDGEVWNKHLPNTIEAFFELEGSGVAATADGGRRQADYARDAHSRFLLAYGLTEHEVPLLKFDPARWHEPFSAGPTDPVSIINDRFRLDPYMYGVWPDDGSLAFSGVLVHCIDGYEDHNEPWKPAHADMSASLIFADQRVPGKPIPVFTCANGGLIFRPGPVTRLRCGNGGDSGGICHEFCESATELGDVGSFQSPGDGCGMSWRPKDFGMYLRRVSAWQKLGRRSVYNEIIVEGDGPRSHWKAHLPDTIEAFFQVSGGDFSGIRRHHENFLRAYKLSDTSHPLLTLDVDRWDEPFRVA